MELVTAIRQRKSIRGYKSDPVDRSLLEKILEIAGRAPSAVNTQPWEFTVVSGDVLEKIKQDNMTKFDSGELPQSESAPYNGVFRERQVKVAIQLFKLMGIAREDKEKRREWIRKGIRFFDAPAAIIISYDEQLGDYARFDIGTVAQNIALLALDYGLGTCMQDSAIMYKDIIRKYTGIPENKNIYICLTIGYPDRDYPANQVVSEREPLENVTRWFGFE